MPAPRCPGCYAYSPDDLGAVTTLRQLSDYRGQDLVTAALALVRRVRPVPVSIVGGEPLVRYRELCDLLPRLDRMGIEVRLVTSAVRPIPEEWTSIGPCTSWFPSTAWRPSTTGGAPR